jgi:hypothetical protein
MGEQRNLAMEDLGFGEELKHSAEQWRADIEAFWEECGYGK